MSGVLVLSGGIAFGAAAVLTPAAARAARRLGLLDVPRSARAHSQPTPYLGGVAVLVGIVAAVVAARTSIGPSRQLVVILLCAAALGVVGLLDDWRPSLPRWRLLVETGTAAAVVGVGVELRVTPWRWANVLITILWVVGIVNATNILDNMDGLASGAVAIAAAGTAFLALEDGQRLVPLMGVAIAAASVGFLVHNRPPARIFMGDAGSLSLGFLLAVTVAKLNLVAAPGPLRLVVVSLLCGVGILDTVLVVVSRVSRRRSPFRGGTDHSSHRLVRAGLTPARAVVVLHAMSAWFVASAILLRHLEARGALLSALGLAGIGLLALWALFRLPAEGPLVTRAVRTKREQAPEGVLSTGDLLLRLKPPAPSPAGPGLEPGAPA